MKHRISPAVVGQFGRLLWRLPGEIQLCRRFFICSSVVMEAVRYSMCAQNAPLRKSRAGAASRARATLASEQHAMQCCLVYPRWWSFRAQHLEVSIVRPQRTVLLAPFCFSIHAFDMSVLSGGRPRVAANRITEITLTCTKSKNVGRFFVCQKISPPHALPDISETLLGNGGTNVYKTACTCRCLANLHGLPK